MLECQDLAVLAVFCSLRTAIVFRLLNQSWLPALEAKSRSWLLSVAARLFILYV